MDPGPAGWPAGGPACASRNSMLQRQATVLSRWSDPCPLPLRPRPTPLHPAAWAACRASRSRWTGRCGGTMCRAWPSSTSSIGLVAAAATAAYSVDHVESSYRRLDILQLNLAVERQQPWRQCWCSIVLAPHVRRPVLFLTPLKLPPNPPHDRLCPVPPPRRVPTPGRWCARCGRSCGSTPRRCRCPSARRTRCEAWSASSTERPTILRAAAASGWWVSAPAAARALARGSGLRRSDARRACEAPPPADSAFGNRAC